jgi:hypothetical protein
MKPHVGVIEEEKTTVTGEAEAGHLFDLNGNFHWCQRRPLSECLIVSQIMRYQSLTVCVLCCFLVFVIVTAASSGLRETLVLFKRSINELQSRIFLTGC